MQCKKQNRGSRDLLMPMMLLLLVKDGLTLIGWTNLCVMLNSKARDLSALLFGFTVENIIEKAKAILLSIPYVLK